MSETSSHASVKSQFSATKPIDIFVIGGGPAGLAAAIAARQRGFSVAVADSRHPPIDKACGEGLMPDTRAALTKLGVFIPEKESHSFRGIRFVSSKSSVEADFPNGGRGLGVRRTVLHRLLAERSKALGISLWWETSVSGLLAQGAVINRQIVPSRWIVGADGGNSLVRSWAGLDRGRELRRFAFRRHYRLAPWSDYMEVHWADGCQLYVTPVSENEVCIALASSNPQFRLDAALSLFPEVAKRLAGAECTSSERGAISATRKLHCVSRGRLALVGDASGSVDCVAGEGLGLAFSQADELAECLLRGDLRAYQQAHNRLARRPALMSRLLLALDRRPSLREKIMRAFDSDPRLFNSMVAMHVGALSSFASLSNGLFLGWQMLSGEFLAS